MTNLKHLWPNVGQCIRSSIYALTLLLGTSLGAQDYLLEIDFPEDAGAGCGDLCIPAISYTDEGCAMLLINRDTARFNASSDECYKLAITYDVIDWCLWDGEYEGALIRRRTEDDNNPLAIDRAVERSERPILRLQGPDHLSLSLTLDRRHNGQTNSACGNTDDGSQLPDNDIDYPTDNNESYRGNLFGGRWRYTQFVKVYDNVPPVVDVPTYGGPTDECPTLTAGQFGDIFGSCETEVTFSFSASDACDLLDDSADDVTLLSAELDEYSLDANGDGQIDANEFSSDGDAQTFISTTAVGQYTFTGTFPLMQPDQLDRFHTLRVQFEDGCGNRSGAYLPFQVIDCKPPAPSCVNGITVTLMPQPEPLGPYGCYMQVNASDFIASPIYDCTGQGPDTSEDLLAVSEWAIYTQNEVENTPNFVPQPERDGFYATPDMDPTTFVYVYAFDEAGNYDFCTTYVQIELHVDGCYADNEPISGLVETETGAGIEDVVIGFNSNAITDTVYEQTVVDGSFLIYNLAHGQDYTITPYLNEEIDNGVTTFDIVLLNKHILGIDTLDSPYKLIAADVNHSGSITVRDIIQMRKVILNIDTEFTDNTSWRFVPADYVFPDPTNPWAEDFPEVENINNLDGSAALHFIGIKVGDVNLSAAANSLME